MWIKQRKIIIKNTQRIKFLKFCINNNIVPKHLYFLHRHNMNLSHYSAIHKYKRLNDLHTRRVLRLELGDAFRVIQKSRGLIFQLVRRISNCIPIYIMNTFIKKQEQSLHYFHIRESQNTDKKIRWLLWKQARDSATSLKTIKYYYNHPINNIPSERNEQPGEQPFSFNPPLPLNKNQQTIEIKLDPTDFQDMIHSSSIDSIKSKWFINLSHYKVPHKVQSLLQLGQNFSLPSTNTNNNIVQIIKNIENNIINLHEDTQVEVRNRSIPVIHNLLSKVIYEDPIDIQILDRLKITKDFVKNNPNIIFTRADKGNITVALDKIEYFNKIEEMLSDTDTYEKINKDPTKKLTNQTRELLTRWKNKEFITDNTYNRIYISDGNLPRAYGLPKIHKPGLTFRIIVSSVDGPLYSLGNYLHGIISKNISKPHSHILNSHQLVEKLNGTTIEKGYDLISLDVVSLFTNVPVNMAIDSVSNRWCNISKSTKIPKNEFIAALQLILESTYFVFNNIVYKQKFGTPMGSPLSPIIAEIVLQDLEVKALGLLKLNIPFYYRYVDDIALAAPRQKIDYILQVFNSLHNRLQFTLEKGGTKLDFLDVTIINNEGTIEFDWYRKPTFSGRVLNFLSQHPITQKRGVIISMVDRAFLLSHPKYQEKNLKYIIETFINNNYPLQFIFETIHMRLKSLIKKRTKKQNSESSDEMKRTSWFLIPYIKKVSEKFKNIAQGIESKLSYFSLNKLDRIIKSQKDSLPLSCNKNVVYKLSCKDCDSTYVGQTKRKLNTRVTEHKRDINKKNGKLSVISEHRLKNNHEFDWDNPMVLDRDKFYYRRLISEMINIKTQNNALNLQSDTEFLQPTYVEILNKL